MNLAYLLDSLDGLKSLVLRLLPDETADKIGCVPMTTDGPWDDAEKEVYARAIGIARRRTYWAPGDFDNVPCANDRRARSKWVDAVSRIDHPYLFLDPDTGFCARHHGRSTQRVAIAELGTMLERRDALIVYRHRYGLRLDRCPQPAYAYVSHGLSTLIGNHLDAFAYQSQAASLFFISKQKQPSALDPFRKGLRDAFAGVSPAVTERRLIEYRM